MEQGLSVKSHNKEIKKGFRERVVKDFVKNKYVYIMALPVVAFFIIFNYLPMYGAIIAFKDYDVVKGFIGSEWVGLKWFYRFFNDYSFIRVFKNTLLLSFENILWGFPAPIIFALLLNEIKNQKYKRIVQTVTYLPHFISLVVICGLIMEFVARDGIITQLLSSIFGFEETNLLAQPENFRTIYITTDIWKEVGWNCIIYLAALSAIDPQLYEAATIDGAGKLRQTWHITIPGIMSTVIVLLIMRVGQLMSIGYEKVMLLYSPAVYETADIISTYVYRVGLLEGAQQFSYTTAIGLFNSLINLVLIFVTNKLSNILTGEGLW